MNAPVHVFFRHMTPSDAIETLVRDKAAGLERLHGRILGCRVVAGPTSSRHRHGTRYGVRVSVALPRHQELVTVAEGEDVYAAVRDAFDATRRRMIRERG